VPLVGNEVWLLKVKCAGCTALLTCAGGDRGQRGVHGRLKISPLYLCLCMYCQALPVSLHAQVRGLAACSNATTPSVDAHERLNNEILHFVLAGLDHCSQLSL